MRGSAYSAVGPKMRAVGPGHVPAYSSPPFLLGRLIGRGEMCAGELMAVGRSRRPALMADGPAFETDACVHKLRIPEATRISRQWELFIPAVATFGLPGRKYKKGSPSGVFHLFKVVSSDRCNIIFVTFLN